MGRPGRRIAGVREGAAVPDAFHARVEEGYHRLIRRQPERFAVVGADRPREEIAKEIAEKVLARLTGAEWPQ